jgi:hypothetical protein
MSNETEKYQAIKLLIERNPKKDFEVRNFDIEFVVGLLYPKIDAHVSAQINHLLKAPFKLLARFQPIIFALDIFLTPTETVSDFEEQRSLFLLYFSQLHADQNSIFSEIIGKNANPAKGQLSVPLSQLLQTSISSSR